MTHPSIIVSAALLVAAAGCCRPAGTVPAPTAEPPWFEDVTAKYGLTFRHDCGPAGDGFSLSQVMGSGGAFLDYDGDGRLDVYLIHNGGPAGKKNQLFHQEPDGTFRDVSAGCGLDVAGYSMGVAVGDVTNDGRPDVLLTEYGATRLFLNEGGGRFRDVSAEAGVNNPFWATAAAFFDYDRDGWLDLIVVNYLDYDRSIKCSDAAGKPEFCAPHQFAGTVARLYRNLGPRPGVRFEDVTAAAGLDRARAKGLGVLCADFDGDGRPDVFVANDVIANHLWINRGDGTFAEEAGPRGVAFTRGGAAAANMGVAWADADGNGLPDVFVTHLVTENHTFWMQGPRGRFRDQTSDTGLRAARRTTGFGAALVDFDRDGWPDLAFVNGGVHRNYDARSAAPFWSQYAQRNQLFANTGGVFREVSDANPALCGEPCVGRGLAVGDFDNDGLPDLLVTEIDGPARLLRNVAPAKGHWLAVRGTIPKWKRDAYGAEITVRAGGKSFWRLLQPSYSYLCSNDPRCHFGLGSNDRYDAIDVTWPDGTRETFPGGPADRAVELRQGEGTPKPATK
jgi:enediyne biosynthesis protein E4